MPPRERLFVTLQVSSNRWLPETATRLEFVTEIFYQAERSKSENRVSRTATNQLEGRIQRLGGRIRHPNVICRELTRQIGGRPPSGSAGGGSNPACDRASRERRGNAARILVCQHPEDGDKAHGRVPVRQ